MAARTVGPMVRDWRIRRRRSQMDLALDVGASPRHLSFVETGRSRPSPELVLALADRLGVPLRERNTLLLAAGHAPRLPHRSLDEPELRRVRASLQRMLDAHDPYPGVAIDRQWNAQLSLFTTLTTFGTPQDVTLDELAVELFFPADDGTDAILHT